jgi:hypothetical protein
MSTDSPTLHLWAATSGWDGPFAHEEVIVAAVDADTALRAAERAFAVVVQPVCRAKMRIVDLGPVAPGVVAGPRRSGESYAAEGIDIGRRCGVEPDGNGDPGGQE